MNAVHGNHPPVEALGPATFTLKRVTGEIEIRGRSPDHLWIAQLANPDYIFNEYVQLTEKLWSVTGRKAHSLSAAFNKINLFSQDLSRGVHNFQTGGQTFNGELSNTATVATNHLYSDISANEVANGGGYTTAGAAIAMSDSSTTGVETVSAATVTWTGSGGGFGPFRYLTVYNVTATTPLKPLVAWFDYGSSISLNAGDTFQASWASGFFTVT